MSFEVTNWVCPGEREQRLPIKQSLATQTIKKNHSKSECAGAIREKVPQLLRDRDDALPSALWGTEKTER